MKKRGLVFFTFFFFLILNPLNSKQILFSCEITEELENNIEAQNKIYLQKKLQFYIDIKKNWINDIPKDEWLTKNTDLKNRHVIYFLEKQKFYTFNLKKFFSSDKKVIESEDRIKFELKSGKLKFLKLFYDSYGEIFFSSEVRGDCSRTN